ncbi:MerR family transcriptional regulator [Salsipaludibacter albus]|uniref:transcriptional regulator FtsR n=1 Tax=Salsipaludibacter albus TaxID=2849650 RepID=UPI001EE495D7|nr:MerR family transcriptional regulator [Salsipaludibacter albus]MBY5162857.1 MerR family transcriptional regulator [Salsipaludibacter albus]
MSGTLTIGEVLKTLQEDFDDITISKIRFLEAEGLISPDRTDSGYRKFDDDDIERLRYVLRAQRDRYLPLKVIREELDRIDAGLAVDSPAGPDPDEVAHLRGDGEPMAQDQSLLPPIGTETWNAEELAEAAGLSIEQVEALVGHGLLPRTPTFDAAALRVARLAGDLLDAGLEARHLRMYPQFAERQFALIEQLVAPVMRQRNPEARSAATARGEKVAERGAALNRALLGNRLRDTLHS